MMLSKAMILFIIASSFLLGIICSIIINSTQLLQLLKKSIFQERQIKILSKKAKEKITELSREKELMSQKLIKSTSKEEDQNETEEKILDLKHSNEELIQKISVLESEADGEDPVESPLTADSYDLSEIDGIGKGYSSRLNDEGYCNTSDLAKINGDKKGIATISKIVGVEYSQVSNWCSMAELMRVNGIRGPFAYLLSAVGIKTLKNLSESNSEDLCKQLAVENAKESKTPTVPSIVTIESWIDESKKVANS